MSLDGGSFASQLPTPGSVRQRTVAVFGPPRSGTSMVACCLNALGVYMGDIRNATYEDPAFTTLINRLRACVKAGDDTSATWQELRQLIAHRNENHSIWGWKFPGLFLLEMLAELREPCVIVTHRDLVAICNRIAESENQSFLRVYGHFSGMQQQIHEQTLALGCPRLLVSYEKALTDKEAFVKALDRFVGTQASESQLRAACAAITRSPSQYLADTRSTDVQGNLDGVVDGKIMGWAAKPDAPETPVTVNINIDGRYDFRVETIVDRPDVARHLFEMNGVRIREGRCGYGFALTIPTNLRDGKEHAVTVSVVDTDSYRIGYSPQRMRFPRD